MRAPLFVVLVLMLTGCADDYRPRTMPGGDLAIGKQLIDRHQCGACHAIPGIPAADGRVVSNVVSQALSERDITVFGDGSQTRSFCYVDDMVGGLMALMAYEGAQPGPINLGNPVELTVNELVETVLTLTGSRSQVVRRPLPIDDPRRRRPDIDKAAEVLDWRPATPLEEGLRRTARWFDAEAGHLRNDPLPEAVGA